MEDTLSRSHSFYEGAEQFGEGFKGEGFKDSRVSLSSQKCGRLARYSHMVIAILFCSPLQYVISLDITLVNLED